MPGPPRLTCIVATVLSIVLTSGGVRAQEPDRLFVGTVAGVSTLSADGRSVAAADDAAVSLYKPENGPALNVFAGLHLAQFFSLQVNYIWNRNDLTLVSSHVTPQGGGYYEQRRRSAQHALVADALIYFRRLDSAIRPYLGTGLCLLRFSSPAVDTPTAFNLTAPVAAITSTRVALRSAVGIDMALSPHVSFRYSFSEIIGSNPISPHLTPPGQRRLANFQNLFGLVGHF